MKKQKQNRFLLLLLVMISSISFAQRNQLEVNPDFGDGSVYYKLGPTGEYNYIASSAQAVSNLNCNVNGITINTTGSSTGAYLFPNNNNELLCDDIVDPASLPNTIQSWSSSSPNGFVTYTFSQPVSSVRISYSAVNSDDVATMSINAPGMQLSDPCGLSISGNVISCTFPAPNGTNPFAVSYGDVALTVSSSTPFTEITLQNTGGNSGWVSGNPCNFMIFNEIIVAVPKVWYDLCTDTVSGSFFDGATINGIPLDPSDATLVEVIPPLGIPGVAYNQVPIEGMPEEITIVNGGFNYNNIYLGFSAEFFVQICAYGSCSLPIRINVSACPLRLANNEIKISPNPSKDGLFMVILENEIKTGNLEVFNFNGEIVLNKNIVKEKEFTVNLENQLKGTFVLKISDGEETITKNLVIQ